MNWEQAVRYCGMNPENKEAQRLYKKAKKKNKLSSSEVEKIYRIAREISWVLGSVNHIINGNLSTPIRIPQKYILYKKIYKEVVLVRKGNWLVEQTSSRVIGKFLDPGVEIYPNPYVSPGHLGVICRAEG
jgi:hypothetical protein